MRHYIKNINKNYEKSKEKTAELLKKLTAKVMQYSYSRTIVAANTVHGAPDGGPGLPGQGGE